jgi:hypothetical protein
MDESIGPPRRIAPPELAELALAGIIRDVARRRSSLQAGVRPYDACCCRKSRGLTRSSRRKKREKYATSEKPSKSAIWATVMVV